jgi:membrane protein
MAGTETARSLVNLIREEEVPFKAASIEFYAIASFVPLLIIALAVLSCFGAADTLVELLQSNLSQNAGAVLDNALTNTQAGGIAGGLGVLVTLWSGTKIFRGISIAFAELYKRNTDLSILDELKKSLVVLTIILVAFATLTTASVFLVYVPVEIPLPGLVTNALALAVLVVCLLPVYYVMPPRSTTVGQALPGTILAAAGWVLLQYAFVFYTRNAGSYDAYGVLGAVLLLITFLYFAAIVLLLGAALNAVLDL